MKIKFDTWLITTKSHPIMFGTRSGKLTNKIHKALFHSNRVCAEEELKTYDADDFEVRNVVFKCDL